MFPLTVNGFALVTAIEKWDQEQKNSQERLSGKNWEGLKNAGFGTSLFFYRDQEGNWQIKKITASPFFLPIVSRLYSLFRRILPSFAKCCKCLKIHKTVLNDLERQQLAAFKKRINETAALRLEQQNEKNESEDKKLQENQEESEKKMVLVQTRDVVTTTAASDATKKTGAAEAERKIVTAEGTENEENIKTFTLEAYIPLFYNPNRSLDQLLMNSPMPTHNRLAQLIYRDTVCSELAALRKQEESVIPLLEKGLKGHKRMKEKIIKNQALSEAERSKTLKTVDASIEYLNKKLNKFNRILLTGEGHYEQVKKILALPPIPTIDYDNSCTEQLKAHQEQLRGLELWGLEEEAGHDALGQMVSLFEFRNSAYTRVLNECLENRKKVWFKIKEKSMKVNEILSRLTL